MKWLSWVCHCCLAWLNCTSGEIFTAITGRSSSLLGTLVLICESYQAMKYICERLIKQWNGYSDKYVIVAKHGWTAPVVRYVMPSLVGVLHCKEFYFSYMRGLSSNEMDILTNMSLLPSMVELHQWCDIYCHHWPEFFTARNFSSHMWVLSSNEIYILSMS